MDSSNSIGFQGNIPLNTGYLPVKKTGEAVVFKNWHGADTNQTPIPSVIRMLIVSMSKFNFIKPRCNLL